ncbi:SGNH/GDSL hydrolase family protein [Cognatilysobacter segetis]|uniref:SGNH/GDSL hydrolase family protein n=1 Tax=Cognatilysobacter segetis TaxID=2492394 RepID=UPI00105E727D|nr:SGNH/GDSL hydrolase family protein [Lysobacter segetis]
MRLRPAPLLVLLLAALTARAGEPTPLRVLFVGNSLTYVNDLPAVLARIGEAQPVPMRIETRTFVAPGGTLAQHWADGLARAALEGGHWDALVLQERGAVPACVADIATRNGRECRDLIAAHREFARAASGHADRVLLLETWHPNEAAQPHVDAGTRELARRTGARVVHCGDALVDLAGHGRRAVFPDGLHPSPAATVVMAAQLVRALTDAPPVRLPASLPGRTFDRPSPALPLEDQRALEGPAIALEPREAAALLALARRYR